MGNGARGQQFPKGDRCHAVEDQAIREQKDLGLTSLLMSEPA